MNKFRTAIPVILLTLFAATRLHADIGGCDDSPENPTLVLGLLVGVASAGYTGLRRLVIFRKAEKNRNGRS